MSRAVFCTGCKRWLDADNFYRRNTPKGLRQPCKHCENADRAARKHKKRCTRCNQVKPLDHFSQKCADLYPNQRQSMCKPCNAERCREASQAKDIPENPCPVLCRVRGKCTGRCKKEAA